MNAVRVIVGGVAALALLIPSVAPSWAADGDVTVTGVVTIDQKPRSGVKICDLFNDTTCVDSDAEGRYSIVPKLTEVTLSGVVQHLRCLKVVGTDDYPGLSWNTRWGQSCVLPVPVSEGASQATFDIEHWSYPQSWGQVVNRSGRPVVGAAVFSGNGRPETLTDSQGRFRVKMGPYLYDQHYLRVTATGYQEAVAQYSPDGDLGKIVLVAAGDGTMYSLSGRVTDASGRAYVGVKVCLVDGGCLSTVGEDGFYYGLIPSAPTSTGFEFFVPGVSAPVSKDRYVNFTQKNFLTNVDFSLGGVRRLVAVTPRISGSPKVGKRLTVRVGTWLPRPVATTCAWYVGSKVVKRGCSSLKVKSSYRGKRIRVKVTGWRSGYGSKTMASRSTSRVYR